MVEILIMYVMDDEMVGRGGDLGGYAGHQAGTPLATSSLHLLHLSFKLKDSDPRPSFQGYRSISSLTLVIRDSKEENARA